MALAAWVGRVHPDGKAHAVLVEERPKRLDLHAVVVLEDGVEADDDQRRASEQLGDPLRLRDAARDAAGAEHLERVEQHDTAAELLEVSGSGVFSHSVVLQEGARAGVVVIRSRRPSRRGGSTA
jgi:hypothetical protein